MSMTFKEWMEIESACHTSMNEDKTAELFTLFGKNSRGVWCICSNIEDPDKITYHNFTKWEDVEKWIAENTHTTVEKLDKTFQSLMKMR